MGTKHANSRSSESKKSARGVDLSAAQETEFNLGYLYRTVEERIDAFAAQAGDKTTVADIADRVGQLLRIKAKNVRALSGAAELLHEMRQDGASASRGTGDHLGVETREALHVRPRTGRTLSKNARARIAAAQRLRWAKTKRKQKASAKGRPGHTSVWTDQDDKLILGAVREKRAAPEVARELLPRMKGRTEGAIRQRIDRLVKKGVLKSSASEGGVPHKMVEAA